MITISQKLKSSFTLLELLIVIGIIAVMAGFVIVGVSSSRSTARDTKRIAEINSINKALIYYHIDSSYSGYPIDPDGGCINADNLQDLIDEKYFSSLPEDPLSNRCYIYVTNGSGSAFKVLVTLEKGTGKMENDGGLYDEYYEVYSTNGGSIAWNGDQAGGSERFYFAGGGVPGGVLVDKYEASKPDATSSSEGSDSSKANSKSNVVVWTGINWTDAGAKCAAAGKHLITMTEWGSIANWSDDNGTIPHGNNNYMKASEDAAEVCPDDPTTGGADRCLSNEATKAGSPAYTWTHNHQSSGIWDLNGNVWEWADFEGVYGVVRSGLYWTTDQNSDQLLDVSDNVYVIVPGDQAMIDAIGGANINNLIAGEYTDEANQGGAAAWVESVSGDTGTCFAPAPSGSCSVITKDPIGQFDMMRYGDGAAYGDGKYYFQATTIYTGTDWHNTSMIVKCQNYDFGAKTFSGCIRDTATGGGGDSFVLANNNILTSIVKPRVWGTGDWYHYGGINSLRTDAPLSNMAVPASISGTSSYSGDFYWGRPYGARAAIRGGGWNNTSRAGVWSLTLNNAPVNDSWSIGFRCSQ